MNKFSVLIISGNAESGSKIAGLLSVGSFTVTTFITESHRSFKRMASRFHPNIIISDLALYQERGIAYQEKLQEVFPDIPEFYFSLNRVRADEFKQLVRNGAWDVFTKSESTELSQKITQIYETVTEHSNRKSGASTPARTSSKKKILSSEEMRNKLLESEFTFRQVWNSSSDGMRVINKEGRILLVNPAFCNMVDKTSGELEGELISVIYHSSFKEIHDNSEQKKVLRDYGKRFDRREIDSFTETELYLWNGRRVWFEISNSYLELQDQDPLLLSIFRDVSSRKRSDFIQQALYKISESVHLAKNMRELYEKIHTIISSLMSADNFYIAIYDNDTQLLSFPYIIDEYETDVEPKPLGKGCTDYVIRTGKELLLTKDLEKELSDKGEIELIGEDSEIWLGVPLKRKEQVIGAIVLQDYDDTNAYGEEEMQILLFVSEQIALIIENMRFQQALTKNEKMFRRVWEASFEGMRLLNGDGIITKVNEAYTKLVDLKEEELVGKPFTVVYDAKQHKQMLRKMKKRLKKESIEVQFERLLTLWNGTKVWFDLSNSYLEMEGGTYLMSIMRDITDRKKTEEELSNYTHELRLNKELLEHRAQELTQLNEKLTEQQEELRELNISKDKFFSIIAHDLRSPFTSLIGYSDFLASELDTLSNEEIQLFSDKILRSARAVFNLLENLLQWSRIQTGRIEYGPTNFALNDIVTDIIDLYQVNALKKEIALKVDVDPDLVVYADKNMVDTIIRNLLSNAIKFTYPKGTVSINALQQKSDIIVEVVDTGTGISKKDLANLFRIDKQISRQGTQEEAGTGLGLILCKEFVEKNGGEITVESTPGTGTTFRFTLPSVDKQLQLT